ncbi:hypothetical protein G6F70_000224 [Rhizopus microsporus]|uniref:Queuosine 5'-phosphate N-glycosylase/hydrolase n=2 Tax=Rhizopus TaxID=4842 RepID=A0A367JAU9_RHIAZ|nr:hypothetical protein G6F71_001652 [Rhizopus microsporus]RCH87063.1 hypothetical protein CU097_009529 [Rhizopus azygosporus]KAG1204772.1 hypothetical protein G6F70_000224 [Rhizopus microsporus]KAG1210869.1 hypothetical protein G6F69_005088 [Rhizopus microsporus]KAG1238182.1 hypothetical protein G6F67_000645 [Rhizopus microsporus]
MEAVDKTATLPTGNFVEAVRTSCRALTEKSDKVKISKQGIDRFLSELDKKQYEELSYDSSVILPLKFSTMEEELNFISVINLLNFGSGYRLELHKYAGRGAFDTIRYGVMAMHIGGIPMDAKSFSEIDIFKVSEIFQFPIDKEVRHETLDFVTMSQPTPLKPLAVGITSTLNTTGKYLQNHGYKSLAQFILDHAKKQPKDALYLVEALVRAFPALHDHYVFDDNKVYLFKKAQIMVYHLWFLLRHQVPDLFDFTNINSLTIFADNVVPTMLIHLGVMEIADEWKEMIEKNVDLSVEVATTLRAASVAACEDIVQASNGLMNTGGLDVYLWQLGKVGDYRKIPRLQLKDTIMF